MYCCPSSLILPLELMSPLLCYFQSMVRTRIFKSRCTHWIDTLKVLHSPKPSIPLDIRILVHERFGRVHEQNDVVIGALGVLVVKVLTIPFGDPDGTLERLGKIVDVVNKLCSVHIVPV
jgi:hypothetical protein